MVAGIAGALVALFVVVAAVVHLRGHGATPAVFGRALRLLALAATAWITIALLPFTIDDSGAAAGYLLGVPVVVAVGVVVADLAHRAVGITTTVGALVMLVWGLYLGLGIGLWFMIPALLLGAAAVASVPSRRVTAPHHN
jgi:hypothetical protein